jgi:hypothetical protein
MMRQVCGGVVVDRTLTSDATLRGKGFDGQRTIARPVASSIYEDGSTRIVVSRTASVDAGLAPPLSLKITS